MMTSRTPRNAYVWIWLPGETEPVVAGRMINEEAGISFLYGQSYLARSNRIAISEEELPMRAGQQFPLRGLNIPGCLRDCSPDAWGRRVILNRLVGTKRNSTETNDLDELTYLLESGSDRIGALDFQASATEYVPRHYEGATLEELLGSAQRVEQGIPLSAELDQALQHGSSIGGARPKALITYEDAKFIAKFSLQSDTYNIVKGEFIAMHLAMLCGIDVAAVKLTKSMNKDVLLIERFDRDKTRLGWERHAMQSALTLLELDEMMARYASYEDLAVIIRRKFTSPKKTLCELFSRLVFNILCGNNDDHARNHAAFWDGKHLSLTPAYDICPQNRVGREASQAMLISGDNRSAKLSSALQAARYFLLEDHEAISIMKQQIEIIRSSWADVCELAALNQTERDFFWLRQFLNPFAFEGLEDKLQINPGTILE